MLSFLGKLLLKESPFPLNALLQIDLNDSESLADESDEFFNFMGWNDSTEEDEEQKHNFTEEELESSISASIMMMTLMMSTASIRSRVKFYFCFEV
jgi:hypothetical protein